MLLLLSLAMLPLKLIAGQVPTNGTFYTSDDQLQLLSVAGDCVFECDNYPPCQMIKVFKNGSGCALDDETDDKDYDVFSYVKKIANNPFDVPLTAAPNQCVNFYMDCTVWASSGECEKNPSWMHVNCKNSCEMCQDPIDGNWGAWIDAGSCSVTCGSGTKQQTRSCDNPPPQHGGMNCSGEASRTVSCMESACPTPIDGNWGSWEDTGPCSVTCGDGTKQQTRACDDPLAQHGGIECPGSASRTTICSESPCPTTAAPITTAGPTTTQPPPTTTTTTTPPPTAPTSSLPEATATATCGGALNIPAIEGDYDTMLAACGGSFKLIDPNNPCDVSSYVVAGEPYYIDVPCPVTPHHDVCDCMDHLQYPVYVSFLGEGTLGCGNEGFSIKAICA